VAASRIGFVFVEIRPAEQQFHWYDGKRCSVLSGLTHLTLTGIGVRGDWLSS
jgi:hypothetical protein